MRNIFRETSVSIYIYPFALQSEFVFIRKKGDKKNGSRVRILYNDVRVKDNSKSKCFLVMRKIEIYKNFALKSGPLEDG